MPTAHPIYFTKLVLENIRCFGERQQLCLTDAAGHPARWTLLVGDNGVGKTTLLQCLARMRPVFNPPVEDNAPRSNPVEPEFAGEADNAVLDALVRSNPNTTAHLEAVLSLGVPLDGPPVQCTGSISTRLDITRSGGALTGFRPNGTMPQGQSPDNVQEPLVLGYGAGRHPKSTSFDRTLTGTSVESLFKVEASLSDPADLLYRLEFASLRNNQVARRRLGRLKRMLVEMLPDVSVIEILGPPISDSSDRERGVRATTPYGTVPLSQLSLGYQTVFAWTVDIAWQLLLHYPDSPDFVAEPAIVIVDEIDLHLHPHWQRQIREYLADHFPNVQFIATAHSPLMAQSSLGANLAVLRQCDDHVQILNDPTVIEEWRLDQVITSDLFGFASARPRDVEAFLDRRRELATKRDRSTDEARELADLDRRAGDLPTAESPSDQSAMDIIRRAAALLKNDCNGT